MTTYIFSISLHFDFVTRCTGTLKVEPASEPTCSGSAAGCVVLRPVTSLTRRLIWRTMTSSELSSNHALNDSRPTLNAYH